MISDDIDPYILLSLSVMAVTISLWGSLKLSHPESALRILDHPNERSSHVTPTPRTGGLAILGAFLLTWIPLWMMTDGPKFLLLGLMAPLLLTAGVSLWDDIRNLPALLRLAFQSAAVFMVLASGLTPDLILLPLTGGISPGIMAWPLGMLFCLWMMNLYNFMDGMDGFAAGMGLFGFGFLTLAGFSQGAGFFGATALLIALSCLGFLRCNFPPARLFMGDVGSVSLGLLTAILILWGERDGLVPLWASLLAFSPFIVDATVTLIARLLKGEKVFQAHRLHIYQWCLRNGWSTRKTLFAALMIMASAAGSALALLLFGIGMVTVIGLACWTILYAIVWFYRLKRDGGLK